MVWIWTQCAKVNDLNYDGYNSFSVTDSFIFLLIYTLLNCRDPKELFWLRSIVVTRKNCSQWNIIFIVFGLVNRAECGQSHLGVSNINVKTLQFRALFAKEVFRFIFLKELSLYTLILISSIEYVFHIPEKGLILLFQLIVK